MHLNARSYAVLCIQMLTPCLIRQIKNHQPVSSQTAGKSLLICMRTPVFIVSTGIISSIGKDTSSCLESLCNGTTGVGQAEILQTAWKDELPVAEVKLTNGDLAALTGMNAALPRTALLSAIAVQEALAPFAQLSRHYPIGFFSANTVGGMDLTETFYRDYAADKRFDIRAFMHHECGAVTSLVKDHFHLNGFNTTISTACSSSANSIMITAEMIRSGMIEVAIAGGADALCRFTLNGFNTLMILDKQPCQPFDQHRRGLNLGEGAGYLLLMSEKAMKETGTIPQAIVAGYANTNDAYHQTASSPEGRGNRLAMEEALRTAGLEPAAIDYINLHGTGTANNDSSEGAAIEKVFRETVPPASSTKGFTGHTLGAAAGVEAVFSTLAISEGLIFPNLRWATQMEDVAFRPVTALQQAQPIHHVLSNSFGFGGNCSSLIFSGC
jgi:3-oxoacyl-[acyl-carrier-protein] synthase-1